MERVRQLTLRSPVAAVPSLPSPSTLLSLLILSVGMFHSLLALEKKEQETEKEEQRARERERQESI